MVVNHLPNRHLLLHLLNQLGMKERTFRNIGYAYCLDAQLRVTCLNILVVSYRVISEGKGKGKQAF